MRWVISLIFTIQIYAMMGLMGIVFAPWALVSPKGAFTACKLYCRWVFLSARLMLGLRVEVRGEVPEGEVMVAAKHQSFLDILMIFDALPAAKFIMKRELMWTPVIGIYAWRIGCVPVNRGQRGKAIKKMVADVEAGRKNPGQLVIYPQGTRVKPGAKVPFKVGTAILYEQTGHGCVPAATNAGLFWPRSGVLRKPGLAVVEFLPRIEPGLDRNTYMLELESMVEAASDRLMEEAGFVAPQVGGEPEPS